MENSRYEWIYREIIKEPNLPVETILLNLSELLKDSLERYNSHCSDPGLCPRVGEFTCKGCDFLNKINHFNKLYDELWEFIKENDFKIIKFEYPI
jgi:hypothetical protein